MIACLVHFSRCLVPLALSIASLLPTYLLCFSFRSGLLSFLSGTALAVKLTLDLTHDHVIMLGTIIPVVMCVMILIGKLIGAGEMRPKSLKISVWMYVVGVSGSLLLMIYKGIHKEGNRRERNQRRK